MMNTWKAHQETHPETFDIVQEGLDKLEAYNERVDLAPAYILAMGAWFI
jgi:hypothetical protein